MKLVSALIAAVLAGGATFELQNLILAPEAHAAGFHVPTGPDWRQAMIAGDPGAPGIDRELDRLTNRLGLAPDQASRIRPLLQQRHDRIFAYLLTGPSSLTLQQFLAERRRISNDMHDRVDALLSADQLALESELHSGAPA